MNAKQTSANHELFVVWTKADTFDIFKVIWDAGGKVLAESGVDADRRRFHQVLLGSRLEETSKALKLVDGSAELMPSKSVKVLNRAIK